MRTILDAAHGAAEQTGTRLGRRRGTRGHLHLVRQPITQRCVSSAAQRRSWQGVHDEQVASWHVTGEHAPGAESSEGEFTQFAGFPVSDAEAPVGHVAAAFLGAPMALRGTRPDVGRTRPGLVRATRARRDHLVATAGVEGAAAGRLSITRRGRLVVAICVLALMGLAVARFGGVMDDVSSWVTLSQPAPTVEQVVTVMPGQSLWDIAGQVAPSRDPRDVVIEVRDANGMPDSRVYAGQELLIPAS